MGGASLLFLSHADDVADHARLHERFGCRRVMHRADAAHSAPEVELQIDGLDPVALDPDLLFLPTPGHTEGSACLLYQNQILFTGDHLWWDPGRRRLSASRRYAWHSWSRQMQSLERLLEYEFVHVLPGHGQGYRAESSSAMRRELERAIEELKSL